MDDDARSQLLSELGANVTTELRNLYRLCDGDAAQVGEMLFEIDKAARSYGYANEAPVILCKTFDGSELLTLREYIEAYIQDWHIGLDYAERVADEHPEALVYNADDAIREPELLQLHSTIDVDLLRDEIKRLSAETN